MTKKVDTTNQEKKLNPNNEQNTETQIDPNIFNPQIFLLDVFSEDDLTSGVALDYSTNATDFKKNVPKLSEGAIENVNSILDINFEQAQSFLNEIPTKEIAQLVPKISLFIVSSEDPEKQIAIPLTDPATINKSSLGSGIYYSGNTIGLTNLEMTLDGSRNPAFNKAYLVKMSFVLDSINTFTGFVPGSEAFGNLTYADVFRSGGNPGSANESYFVKLTISHSSSPKNDILKKYGLDSDQFSFSLSLTLRQSSIAIGENLKTTIDVTYTGYEENLFERKSLFDFLGLDFREEIDAAKKQRSKAKESFEIATNALKSYYEKKYKTEQERINDDIAKTKKDITDKFFGGDVSKAEKFLFLQKQFEEKVKGGGTYDLDEVYYNAGGTVGISPLVGRAPSRRRQAVRENRELLTSLANKLQFSLPEQQANVKKEIEAEKKQEMGKLENDNKSAISLINARLDNIRMFEISRVLEEAFFGKQYYDSGVIKEININAEELKKYYAGLKEGEDKQAKDLVKSTDAKNSKNRTQKKASPETNTKTGDEPDYKKINQIQAEIKSTQSERDAVLRQYREFEGQSVFAEGAKKAIPAVVKNYETRLANLREQLKKISQTSDILGGTTQEILDKLVDIKQIEYILLGDLLRLIFAQLHKILYMNSVKDASNILQGAAIAIAGAFTGSTSVQSKVLNRTRVLLTDISLPKNGQSSITVDRNIYNIPISIKNLKFIFADRLYGKSKNSFTLFEMVEEIQKLVSLSFQNKAILINDPSINKKYTISKATYSLKGEEPNFKIITSSKKEPGLKHGIVIYFKTKNQINKRDSSYKGNTKNKIPHFYFGGYDRGAVKKIELELIQKDNMQLAVMEQLGESPSSIIPAIFKTKITTVACPIFYLAMDYFVATPTIGNSAQSPWLFAQGFYAVSNIVHSYQPGGAFQTVIEGLIQNSTNNTKNNSGKVKTISASEGVFDNVTTAVSTGLKLFTGEN